MSEEKDTVPLWVDPRDLKMLRENLCIAQLMARGSAGKTCLQDLIDQVDVYRPVGRDGKHGDKHTGACGCGD